MVDKRLWLTATRILKGKTLDEVFVDTGIPQSTLSSYECGTRNISFENAKTLSKYYGLSIKKFQKGA